MKSQIIKIGNSKGLRLPKSVIEQCEFNETVELEIKNKRLIVSSSRKPREGWAESFAEINIKPENELMKNFKHIDHEIDDDWTW